MALSSNNLEAFYTLSQTLNFTKAAEKLHITQSALSQRILNLEQELETTLFIRDRAGLKLTEKASELLRYCQIKDNLESEFLQSIKSQNGQQLSGIVRIGGFSSIAASILVPTVAAFAKNHSQVKFQVVTREFNELFSLLKRGEIDYMILDDRLDRDELERVYLGKEINYLVKAKNYSGEDVYLDHDENDETTLNYLKVSKTKSKMIKRHYLDDIYGLLEGAKNGLGKAVLPRHLIKNEKDLTVIKPQQTLEVPVYLYYYSKPYYSKLHNHIIDNLKQSFLRML